jgi:Pyruvate/2-oxoacid:ferredoxin oxidoreductase delta subunit
MRVKNAVQIHGGKSWALIAALVPGRSKQQCSNRWYQCLDPSLEQANGRMGKWVEDEDNKLKGAIQKHGCKSWDAVASLVSGRTKNQCRKRWYSCRERRSSDKDIKKLNKDTVQTHAGRRWDEIAARIPGPTKIQADRTPSAS